ncbi:MAG: hypothetical protein V3U71_08635 [Cocleimonas sp.]
MFGTNDVASKFVLLTMLWIGFITILLVSALYGNLSLTQACLWVLATAFLQLMLSAGLVQLLLFESTGTNILIQLKRILFGFSSSFFYPLLILGVFLFDETQRVEKSAYLLLFALLSLFWFLTLLKRIRLIEDTSITTLYSGAQGYAVIKGNVSLYDDEYARGPGLDFPVMVWYRKVFRTSSAGFILNDERGKCTVDPRNAEVIAPLRQYNGHSFHAIYPKDEVYIIGLLETLSRQYTEHERKSFISSKLIEWKRAHLKFLNYFDSNSDGKIDDQEMSTARDAAERIVDKQLENIYIEPATHTIYSPSDSRPFIISSIHPDKLILRYKRAMLFHLSIWIILSIFIIAMQVH